MKAEANTILKTRYYTKNYNILMIQMMKKNAIYIIIQAGYNGGRLLIRKKVMYVHL